MAKLRKALPNFTAKDNTLARDVKADPADRIGLEIGDSKQPGEFLPQAKVMRWDNEVNLSVRRQKPPKKAGKGPSRQRARVPSVDVQNDRVIYEDDEEAVHIYEKPEVGEDGGLEIELHLKSNPGTNRFEFSIQTKGLNFYYQPELTPEEIKEGAQRPENVVGSYAVYHASKRDNIVGGKAYKTGKFCHIYRPHITDADGNETWGELELDEQAGILTVVVPEDFLVTAAYPVVVDPTFGYTSIGGSRSKSQSNILSHVASSEAGTLDSISAYLGIEGATDFDTDFAVFERDTDTSGAYVADTSSITITSGSAAAWKTISLSASITARDYFLGVALKIIETPPQPPFFIPGEEGIELYFDNAATNESTSLTNTGADSWPMDVSDSDRFVLTRQNSVYATYTATASSSPPTVTTQAVSSIGETTATGNGNVTDDGGETITERGVCWSTSPSPTTADSKATSAGTTGAFTASMTGLTAGTTYYVRAYAINSEGTSYGSEVSFTTLNAYTLNADTASFTLTGTAVGLSRTYSLTADTASFAVTGVAANLIRTLNLSADAASFTLSGNTATFLRQYLLSADTGSFTATGNDAAVLRTLLLATDTATYTLTGNDAALTKGFLLSAASGSFVLTGQSISFRREYRIEAETESFTLTGYQAGIGVGLQFVASTGSFTITGYEATFRRALRLEAEPASFALTGNATGLNRGFSLTAEAGSFTLTGQDADLFRAYTLNAALATYTLTGQPADIDRRLTMTADTGTFVLTGYDTGLTAARVLSTDPGSFTVSGYSTGLIYSQTFVLQANTGSFMLSGSETALRTERVLSLETDTFALSGATVGLTASRLLSTEADTYILTGSETDLLRRFDLTAAAETFLLTGYPVGIARSLLLEAETETFQLTGHPADLVLELTERPYCPAPDPYARMDGPFTEQASPYQRVPDRNC